jgi:hypothetical protein
MFHQILKQGEFATGKVITFQVMAFAGMSPGDPNAIGAFTQRCQKEFGIHPPRAGNADDPDVGRIFHPADAGKISGAVAAPIAQKSCNFWFPIRHCYLLLLDTGFSFLDAGLFCTKY